MQRSNYSAVVLVAGVVFLTGAVFLAGCATNQTDQTNHPINLGYEAAKQGDFQAAINYWTPEARKGNPVAIFSLGLLAEHGAGMPADRNQAIQMYTLAAKMGNSDARLRLAQLGAPVPEIERSSIDPNVLLMLLMMQNQQQSQPQRPLVPPVVVPPTYNTNCTRDYFGNVNCTTRQQ